MTTEPSGKSAGQFAVKATLLAASALTVMSGATIAPSLPALYEHFAGTPHADLLTRLVLTAPALSIVIVAPLAGIVIDRFGRRSLLLGATVGYAIAGSAGLVLDTLYAILISRVLLGVAVACIMTCVMTLVGDYFAGEARARYMGLQASFMSFGGVVFILLGGALASVHWRGPFVVYVLALVLLPAMASRLYEPAHQQAPASAPPLAAMPMRLTGLIYGVALLSMMSFYMIPAQLPFYLTSFGIRDPALVSATMSLAIFVMAMTAAFYGRIRRHLSHAAIYAVGFAFFGAGYALMAIADTYVGVMFGATVAGIGIGMNMPNSSVWLLAMAPPAVRGRLSGGLSTSVFLGQFLSPLAAQPVINSYGLATAYGVAAVVLAALSLAFMVGVVTRAPILGRT